jgi:hypothetical protein
MTTAANPLALDIVSDSSYTRISNGGVKAAMATIATQLPTYRFPGTAAAAVAVLRDLVDDILRSQFGNTNVGTLPPAAISENLVTDGTAAAALGTIRTSLVGLSTTGVPAVSALPSKQAFATLWNDCSVHLS